MTMISITDSAQGYLRDLLARQEIDGLALHLSVTNPKTYQVACDFRFYEPDEVQESDIKCDYEGFSLYFPLSDEAHLEEAKITYEKNDSGEENLSISTPNATIESPNSEDPLSERVTHVLHTEINPGLASHGGNVELVDITDDGTVVLQFGGGCQGCSSAEMTLDDGVKRTLLEKFPGEVTGVTDATNHSLGDNPYY